jgi:hypothetical protein
MYKTSLKEGIWPMMAAFAGKTTAINQGANSQKGDLYIPKRVFNLFTGLY